MSDAIQKQILRLEREQAAAFNRGDLRGALKMFDKSFVGFSSTTHMRIRGLPALLRTFHYYRKRSPKLAYSIQQPHVHLSEDTASVHGRGTHVFVRKGNTWRVIHEHFSRAH